MHVSWLDPHKMRRLTVVGRDKMAVFDDMEPERKVTVYDKGAGAAAGGRVAGARGGHPHPEALARGAAAPRVRALPLARRGRGRPARSRRRQGVAVVRALELLQQSLEHAPPV